MKRNFGFLINPVIYLRSIFRLSVVNQICPFRVLNNLKVLKICGGRLSGCGDLYLVCRRIVGVEFIKHTQASGSDRWPEKSGGPRGGRLSEENLSDPTPIINLLQDSA
jgi:hypothetical protein